MNETGPPTSPSGGESVKGSRRGSKRAVEARRPSEASRPGRHALAERENSLLSSRTRLSLDGEEAAKSAAEHWTYALRPGGRLARVVEAVTVLLSAYYAFAIPYRVAMTRAADPLRPFLSDWAADVLFVALAALRLVTPYINKHGAVEVRVSKVIRQYMKTSLVWDVVAVVPFDVMAVIARVSPAIVVWLRVNRYLATRPLLRYLRQRNTSDTTRNTMSGVRKLLLVTLLIGHYAGCAFYYMASNPARSGPDWVSRLRDSRPEMGEGFGAEEGTDYGFFEYLIAVYWSFSLVTSMGPGDIAPTGVAEIGAFLCGDLLSICWYSFLMMYLSDFMAGKDSEIVSRREEFLAIGRFIKEKGLGAGLAADLVSFFDFRSANSSSDQGIFRELPRNLQVHVSRQVSRPLISSNKIFAECDDNFVDSLSVLLQEQTMLPKTGIFRRGDLSHHLYFVASGVIEVVATDPLTQARPAARPPAPGREGLLQSETRREVTTGTCLGEIAFFFGIRQPYSAAVSSKGHASICILNRADFQELAKQNPTQEELIFKKVLGACDDDGKSVASGTSEAAGGEGRRSVHEIVRQAKEKREQEKTVAMLTEAHKGDLEGVKRYLLMDVDVDSADYDGRTALHLAASDGHIEIIHLLLDRGANVNARDRYGGTPLIDAVRHKQDEAAALLIRLGAAACFEDEATMLCTAAAEGDIDALRRLVECGVNPSTPDYDGRTALHLAACNGNRAAVQYLVGINVDLSPLDRNKGTPLRDAIRHGHLDIAELLLRHGAEMKVENASGMLCNAAARGDVDALRLLIRFGLPVNEADYDGRTALHLAAAEGHLQCLEFLLLNGADIAAVDRWSGNALHDAVRHAHKLAAQVLLDWGAALELGRFPPREAARLEAALEALLASRPRGGARPAGVAPKSSPLLGAHAPDGARRPSLSALAHSEPSSRRASASDIRPAARPAPPAALTRGSLSGISEHGGAGVHAASLAHGLRAVAEAGEGGEYDPAIVRAQEEFEKSLAEAGAFLDKELERLQQLRRRSAAHEAKQARALTHRTASVTTSSPKEGAAASGRPDGVLVLGEDTPPSGRSGSPRAPRRLQACREGPPGDEEEGEASEEDGGGTGRSDHSLTGFENILRGVPDEPPPLPRAPSSLDGSAPSLPSPPAAPEEAGGPGPLFRARPLGPPLLDITPPSRTSLVVAPAAEPLPPPPAAAFAAGPRPPSGSREAPVVLTEFEEASGDLVFDFAAEPASLRAFSLADGPARRPCTVAGRAELHSR